MKNISTPRANQAIAMPTVSSFGVTTLTKAMQEIKFRINSSVFI